MVKRPLPHLGGIVGLVLWTLLVNGSIVASEPQIEKIEKNLEMNGVRRVRLQNVNGPVRLSTWNEPMLKLEAVKRAKGPRADRLLRETEVRIGRTEGTIEIETILPRRSRWFTFPFFGNDEKAEVSYELKLPPQTSVEIETVNGRIVAEKRTGSLHLSTVNGSVRVESHDGPLRVATVNGSVDVEFLGALKTSDLETVNGSVAVNCSRRSSIQYRLQTVNGRIRSELEGVTVEGRWGPREAKGTWNGGTERLAVETVNGEIRLSCPTEKNPQTQ